MEGWERGGPIPFKQRCASLHYSNYRRARQPRERPSRSTLLSLPWCQPFVSTFHLLYRRFILYPLSSRSTECTVFASWFFSIAAVSFSSSSCFNSDILLNVFIYSISLLKFQFQFTFDNLCVFMCFANLINLILYQMKYSSFIDCMLKRKSSNKNKIILNIPIIQCFVKISQNLKTI